MRPPRDDAGVSLVELLVAMSLMAMVGAMFTTGIVQIRSSINKADSTYESQNQINAAFLRLDQEIRYASGVSTPDKAGGDWYVEYSVDVKSVDTCVELRVNAATRQLQRRQWGHGATPLQPTGWTTLATGVTATTPFATTVADKANLTGLRFQTLTLDVTSTTGAGAMGSTRATNVTFTALNTTITDSSKTCVEGRSVSS
jgi:hypothetical protein